MRFDCPHAAYISLPRAQCPGTHFEGSSSPRPPIVYSLMVTIVHMEVNVALLQVMFEFDWIRGLGCLGPDRRNKYRRGRFLQPGVGSDQQPFSVAGFACGY